MPQPDVIIIGGGVIGCATAYFLERHYGLGVVLTERGEVGGGASSAAAGVLAVASSRASHGVLFELRRRSAAMFAELVEELQQYSSIDPEYVTSGLLQLAFGPREAASLAALVEKRRTQGFQVDLLDPAAVRRLAPRVGPQVSAGAAFAQDHAINPERFTAALAQAARRCSVRVLSRTEVTAFETGHNRVLRVRAGEQWLSPAKVVIAAGVDSPEVCRLLGVRVPVRPMRGEMLSLRPRFSLPHFTVSWGESYLVPRRSGELVVGSTSEYTGRLEVTCDGVQTLLRRALRVMPDLAEATLLRTWAGLRPCSTIRRPIISPLPRFDNVVLATGHHRAGILLAPITARLVGELITSQPTTVSLTPFGYRPR
jgi:glycine oxidase